jgi:hypothetical protein
MEVHHFRSNETQNQLPFRYKPAIFPPNRSEAAILGADRTYQLAALRLKRCNTMTASQFRAIKLRAPIRHSMRRSAGTAAFRSLTPV